MTFACSEFVLEWTIFHL